MLARSGRIALRSPLATVSRSAFAGRAMVSTWQNVEQGPADAILGRQEVLSDTFYANACIIDVFANVAMLFLRNYDRIRQYSQALLRHSSATLTLARLIWESAHTEMRRASHSCCLPFVRSVNIDCRRPRYTLIFNWIAGRRRHRESEVRQGVPANYWFP